MVPQRRTLAGLSPEELEDLDRLIAGEMLQSEWKAKHRAGTETVQRLRKERKEQLGLEPTIDAGGGSSVTNLFDGDVLEHIAFNNEVWLALEKYQAAIHVLDDEVDEVDRRVKDNEPIIVVFMSDLHIGHIWTQHKQLRLDCETIRNTPGIYTILGGDLIDNVTTGVAPRGMHHENISPGMVQKMLAEELTEYLGAENVLAMILGNHDEFSKKSDDFDVVRYLAKHIGCPYLGAFGFVNVQLGKQEYRLLVGHQFRMGSSFNLTHPVKRFWEFHGDSNTDATFLGHRHEGATETAPKQKTDRFWAQSGTYLKRSVYSQRLGFGEARPTMPGVLLWPDTHTVMGIHDVFAHGPWLLEAACRDYRERTAKKSKAA